MIFFFFFIFYKLKIDEFVCPFINVNYILYYVKLLTIILHPLKIEFTIILLHDS